MPAVAGTGPRRGVDAAGDGSRGVFGVSASPPEDGASQGVEGATVGDPEAFDDPIRILLRECADRRIGFARDELGYFAHPRGAPHGVPRGETAPESGLDQVLEQAASRADDSANGFGTLRTAELVRIGARR